MNARSSRKTFNRLSAAAMTALAALVLAAAPARAGSQPQSCLDECYGKPLAVHVTGWAFDPDVSSQSIGIQVYLYTDSGCTTLYDNPTLTANVLRSDVNQAKGITGNHGFNADVPVAAAGDYWVKVFPIDATGDGNPQVGTTRSVTVAPRLPGSGTPADPYRISSAADWNIFASNISAGFDSNSCYRLGADIGSVTVPVGTAEHPFAGTFDGGSNTLTVALSGSDRAIAPFFRVSGATIRNLKVAGTVSGAIHCSGLVGEVVGGPNVIESCEVAAAITCSASHFGGFIGHSVTYAATLRGCVFSGSLSGGTYVATFNGWSDGGAATTLIDCLDKSTSTHPIGRGHDAACVSNTYYFATKNFNNGERLWSEGKRGKRAYAVTSGEGVTINFGAPAATYGTTGITAYGAGMAYGGTFYASEGDVVPLTLSATPPSGMILDAYVSSAGTLSVNGDAGTLTMPAANVAVNANWTPAGLTDLSTLTGGYTAADGEVLTGETAYTVTIPAGATVTLSNAVIEASDGPGITCLGDAAIVLEGINVARSVSVECPGIQAGPANTTLEISGGGTLTAAGGADAAGIGGGWGGSCGDIVISGGTIAATGGDYAAGIGGGPDGECGDIVISGGTVTATGGKQAAGIGSGDDDGECGDITITDGTVTATGGDGAAGIGSGNGSKCGDITITDGVTLLTSVSSGSRSNIGAGNWGVCGTVTVGGVETGEIAVSPYVYCPSDGPFAVSFDSNGGNGSMAGQSFASGIPQNLSSNGFTRAGWLFYGWNTRADGRGTYYYDGQSALFGADTTLYAQWCGADVTLTPETGDITLVDGQVLSGTGGTSTHVVVVPGATVTLSNAVIEASDGPGITCLGDAVIVLEGSNVARSVSVNCPGILAGPTNTTLKICGGGSLTAAGGEYAAGIGSGWGGSECGDIVISGGSVTATGGEYAAGIGGGWGGSCGDIVISGGTITATGGEYAAGIGSGEFGSCGDITIADGVFSVTATCGEQGLNPIGAGDGGTCGTVTVAPGLPDETEDNTRTITNPLPPGYTAQDGEVLTGEMAYTVTIPAGATVTLSNAVIEASDGPGITCLGDAVIVLEGINVARSSSEDCPGIQAGPAGTTLEISGGGTLTAAGGEYASGIGNGADGSCGDIVISGGTVTATGGDGAAGIGSSGWGGSCGDIVISGGTITATGGDLAAGIGSGCEGECGDIVISGGTVTATGGNEAAGIGSGAGGSCGDITIADGVFSVTATCGEWGLNPIGAGDGGTCGTVTVAPGLTDDTEGQTRWLYHAVVLTGESGEILLTNGQTLVGTGGENTHVLIAGGATVMLRDCDLMEFAGEGANTPWAGITCLGDATIILEGNNAVRGFDLGYPGVFVPDNKMLVIRGTGRLAAFVGGDMLDSAPGISGAVTIGGTAYPDGIAEGIVLCCAIGTTEDWDELALAYESVYVPGLHACVWLTSDDVVVNNMMGNADHPFHGTFDGCGHTLTLNLGEGEGGGGGIVRSAPPATSIPFTFVAPFSVVNDATIKNVKVGGEVRGVQFAAGLVGYVAGGTNRIENCVVEASFLDVWRCGGIVCAAGDVFDPESDPGRDGVSTTLAGCVFDGDIDPYCNIANTLVGVGCDVVVDCLDVSDSGWPMFTDEYDFVINNTYYTATNKVDIYVMEILGARATAKAERPSSIGGERTDYGFVKAYASGLVYGGMYYVVEGGVVAEGGTVVPDEWLAQYYPGQEDRYATIVNSTAANGRKVWACYVADLDPTDPDDDLVAGIDVSGGKVRVYILKGQSPNRYYSLFGYETLDAKPIILRNGLDFDYSGHSCRFFRIEVSLDPPVIGPK